MDNTTVIPMPITWNQARQTKLGLATISIEQVQDIYEATVSFANEGIETFSASETFGDARGAFHWGYGLKQAINDDFATYTRQGSSLVENKPKKGKVADIISIDTAINSVKHDYANFALGHTSASKGDTISVSQVNSSSLSQDDKATLLALMARAKAVANA